MDAGEYETNTLLINNLACIAFRIYEPVASQSSTYTFNATDVERDLRSKGYLVYMDAARRGIWCFYLVGKNPPSVVPPEQYGLAAKLEEVCGYTLGLVEEGSFEPISLLKGRLPGAHPINTPTSSSSAGSAMDMSSRSAQAFNTSQPTAPSRSSPAPTDPKIFSGMMPDTKGYSAIPIQEVHSFFITATLSSLTTSFCHQIGAVALNHRTVLLPPQAFQTADGEAAELLRTSALATFRVYLTTTGSLVISLYVSLLRGLISSAEALGSSLLPTGTNVLAAPLGAFGALQGIVDADSHVTDHGFGQSPDTQISRSWPDSGDKFSQWKSTCSMLLRLGGMSPSLLDGCVWLNIQFLQRKPFEQRADGKRTPSSSLGPTAPWPSVLCFRKPKIEAIFERPPAKEALADGGDEIDPLSFAMDWLKDVPEREKQLERRAKERLAASDTRSNADVDNRNNATSHFSPLTMRRSSNGGLAPVVGTMSMYPTPPDGVHSVQQHGMAATFDGAVLSPEIHAARATVVGDADATLNRPALASSGFDDGWNGNELKREQPSVGFLEGENIYGDLGDNLFEGNELTDADFDFFGDGQSGGDLDMVMGNMGSSMDPSQATNAPTYPTKMERDDDARPSAPEFAKPELKHARSTLAEESRQLTNMSSSHANSAIGIRRHTSPFNAETVYDRIRAFSRVPPRPTKATKSSLQRRRSVFGRLVFDPSLSLTSMKYQGSGRFHYTIPDDKDKDSQTLTSFSAVSPVSLPGPATTNKSRKDLPAPIGLLLSGVAGASASSPPKRDDGLVSDSSESDSSSDDDGVNYAPGGLSSPAKSGIVRRRDDDAISMAASFKDLENTSADSPGYGHIDLSRLSVPDVPELSLTKYFADPEPSPTPLSLLSSSHDFVMAAQILTAQAATGSLKLYPTSTFSELLDVRRSLIKAIRYSAQGLRKAIPRSLAVAVECQLRPLVDVQDVPLLAPPTRLQARPPGQEPRPPIFPIASPHLELRRYETQLSVLPSAISFWESLGLGPSRGAKNVVSICVVPYQPGRRENVADFVERVRSMYESLKLGSFDPLPTVNGVVDGVQMFVPESDAASPGYTMSGGSALSEAFEGLAKALTFTMQTDKNFVVFFPYAPESPSSIVESCAAFLELSEAYKRCMAEHRRPIVNELVLQLIPLDDITSETSIAVLTQSESARLCLEVYDRCTLFGGPMPAPAILLEPPLPKQVEFRVTTEPSPDILHENSCIHIAYAQSVDDRWISAAWTDNQGLKQHTASYCLGMRGRRISTSLADVLYEIWETTSDFISTCKVHWRVVITKCGPMDQQEADLWTQFAHLEPKGALSLVLMTVDTNPSLQLVPPSIRVPLNTPSVFYTTPVSTPQASSILSPDQGGSQPTPMGMNPPTPGGGDGNASSDMPDADATLVDILDTTWGAVLSHRLNNSTSLTELNPSLASGYLIKRCGPRAEDALVAMEVNIVHMEGSPRGFEVQLREMLGIFRALGTLARARGVVDREGDVRPWHVAAAEKAVRALSQLM
ncbi:mediator of RNA polymerase II transcription subunit 13 [Podospora conica]|nr:mediator of RNA polymerase II transcription subunit 13 [Schizothecium conicum]